MHVYSDTHCAHVHMHAYARLFARAHTHTYTNTLFEMEVVPIKTYEVSEVSESLRQRGLKGLTSWSYKGW